MKKYFNYFIYVSFAFLAYYLYRQDYFAIAELQLSYTALLSLLFLCLGFLWGAVAWWKTLSLHGYSVTFSSSIASHGLVMFAKYIPGKAWTILGRAAYLSSLGYTFVDSSLISLKAQIIAVWTGLLLGSIASLFLLGLSKVSLVLMASVIGLAAFMICRKVQSFFLRLLSRLMRQDLRTLSIDGKQLVVIATYYCIYWLLLIAGFRFLLQSLSTETSVLTAFVLPLAVTLGVLAIVSPGGLGIREGVMVGLLGLAAIPMKMATSISIVARLWFLLGEVFIFLTAFFVDRKQRQQEVDQKSTTAPMNNKKQYTQRVPVDCSEATIGNRVAKYYEQVRYNRKYSLAYHKWHIQKMLSYVDIRGRVLDNGCGTGITLSLLPQKDVYGSDISEEMLIVARGRNHKIVLADSENLPFRDESFDIIFSRGLLHHLNRPDAGITEMHRLLKPGGEIIVVDTNRSVLNSLPRVIAKLGGHFSVNHKNFDKNKYARLIHEKFKIEKIRFFGYVAYPLIGYPDLIDVFRWFPFKVTLTRILIAFDSLISEIPLINSQGWGILVKAKKEPSARDHSC